MCGGCCVTWATRMLRYWTVAGRPGRLRLWQSKRMCQNRPAASSREPHVAIGWFATMLCPTQGFWLTPGSRRDIGASPSRLIRWPGIFRARATISGNRTLMKSANSSHRPSYATNFPQLLVCCRIVKRCIIAAQAFLPATISWRRLWLDCRNHDCTAAPGASGAKNQARLSAETVTNSVR